MTGGLGTDFFVGHRGDLALDLDITERFLAF